MDYSAHDYNSLKRERDRLARRVDELKAALDRDKTGLAHALARVREIARMYAWIPAGEWGCYDYTKQTCETLRAEVGNAFDEIITTAEKALVDSGTRATNAILELPAPRGRGGQL